MAWISLEIAGAAEAKVMMDGLTARLEDLEPVIEIIHQQFLAIEKARFNAEGPGWAPLAETTLAAKRRKGYPDTILEASGKLRDSFINPDGEGHVFEQTVTPDLTTVEMGSEYRSPTQRGRWADTALAAFHQEGTDRMPARPILADLDVQAAAWTTVLSKWITAGAVAVH